MWKKPKILIGKNISTLMFIAVLFTITKIWKQPKGPSVDEWISNNGTLIVECFLAIKKKKIFPFATVWGTLC